MNTISLSDLLGAAQAGGRSLTDLAPLMKAITVLATAGVREHFTTQTGPDGKPWKQLARPRVEGGSGSILRDKGTLMNSVRAHVRGTELVLTASHPGANVHQFGATIRPTHAHALTLPLTTEAKRIGSPRQNRFPRPLFIYKNKGGNAFLAESRGGRLALQYLLRRSVTIPARPYLGFSQKTLDKIARLAADRLADVISGVFAGRVAGLRIIM